MARKKSGSKKNRRQGRQGGSLSDQLRRARNLAQDLPAIMNYRSAQGRPVSYQAQRFAHELENAGGLGLGLKDNAVLMGYLGLGGLGYLASRQFRKKKKSV